MNPWRSWVAAWTAKEPATALAAVRITLGLVLVNDSIKTWLSGAIPHLYFHARDGGLPYTKEPNWLVDLLGGREPHTVYILLGAQLVGSMAMTLGLGGRWTVLLLVQLHVAVQALAHGLAGGYDFIIGNALWLLVLSGSTATLSLDCWLKTKRWTSDRLVYAFPRYLMVLQLVVMYTSTGWAKRGWGWFWPYDQLYYALRTAGYPRIPMPWLSDFLIFTRIGTAVTWYWEAFWVVMGLWFVARRGWIGSRAEALARKWDLRPWWLGLGVMLHVGIWVTMEIGPFSGGTLSLYWAFLEPRRRARRAEEAAVLASGARGS